jgi:ABC-type multidrug transport system fused ATPase/permease subunit
MNIRLVLYYLSVYKKYIGKRFMLVFVLSALASVFDGFGIAMLLPLIAAVDVGFNHSAEVEETVMSRFLVNLLDIFGITGSMLGILVFIAVIFLVKGFVLFVANTYQAHLRAELLKEMKTRLFERYSHMEYSYYATNNTGHFVNVITTQATKMIVTFGNLKDFVTKAITVVVYILFAFFLAWKFALIAVAAGIVLIPFFRIINRHVHVLSRQAAVEQGNLNKFLVQTLQSFKYLVSTGQIDSLRHGLLDSVRKLVSYDRMHGIFDALTHSLIEPVSIVLVLIIIVVQVLFLEEPLAPIFISLMLFNRAIGAMMGAQNEWQRILSRIGSMEFVEHELRNLEARQEMNGGCVIERLSRKIEFRGVSFKYTNHSDMILENIDLVIPANTTVALVGESGAGKSTLVDMLTLLLKPTAGELLIDGVNASLAQLQSWRQQVGYVSQETVMFDDTIANNICLWSSDYNIDTQVMDRIKYAAKLSHIDTFIASIPDGYDTLVGDRGIRLSGGQRQRIFLARELYKAPRLLILDEATSALDSESERCIQESIDSIKGQITVVLIAHRLSTIQNADKIYVLDKGGIVEDGSYDELVAIPNGRFNRMVKLQSLAS